tara:strand:+ start:348 stop:1226 length:879 start_codon:yes stop_codon:yes gene_type:complete
MHKSGFVTIIGNPNVGKSTFLNNIIGENISIISDKAQTTRHRLLGILNADDFQIIFTDTPGIIKTKYELQSAMMSFVKKSLEDSDVIIYIVSNDKKDILNEVIHDLIKKTKLKLFLLLNKVDLMTQEEVRNDLDFWQKKYNPYKILPISALNNYNLDNLLMALKEVLPKSPPYFPKDSLTDRTVRFIVSEIIREKIFKRYEQEIPYSSEVVVEEYKEKENIVHISCIIYIERESQKGIIIGKNGSALKSLGISSRKSIQNFIGKKVFLAFNVKVLKDWRRKKQQLKKLGYIN